jgi:hypothetical protein
MKCVVEFFNIKSTPIPFDIKEVASFLEPNPSAPDKVKKFDYEIQIALRRAYRKP